MANLLSISQQVSLIFPEINFSSAKNREETFDKW